MDSGYVVTQTYLYCDPDTSTCCYLETQTYLHSGYIVTLIMVATPHSEQAHVYSLCEEYWLCTASVRNIGSVQPLRGILALYGLYEEYWLIQFTAALWQKQV